MDRELAAALAGELPATAGIKVDTAVPVLFTCPEGSRGAMFNLPDGQISVILRPAGASIPLDSTAGETVASASAPTSGGLSVDVVSVSATPDGPVPYVSDLNRFATAVAEIY